jgi:hypothetical protein
MQSTIALTSKGGIYILLHVVFAACDDFVVDGCRALHVGGE